MKSSCNHRLRSIYYLWCNQGQRNSTKGLGAKSHSNVVKNSKLVVLVASLCATVGLFSLPVVLHHVTVFSDLSLSNPTQVNTTNDNITLDPLSIVNNTMPNCHFSWGKTKSKDEPSCDRYRGRICEPVLTEWHECVGLDGDTYVESISTSHSSLDMDVSQLKNLLGSCNIQFNTHLILCTYLIFKYNYTAYFPLCQAVAIPFYCQYNFPLKDCSSGIVYTASQDDCTRISSTVCATPWQLASTLGYEDMLPKCDTLPKLEATLLQFNDVDEYNITCRNDFFLANNNTCLPRCDRFEQHPHVTTQISFIIEVIAVIIALLSSILALILSIYNRKNMFRFPSIFLVFFNLDICLAASLVLITSMDRFKLLCSSNNLIESIRNPTSYCLISGAMFHYMIVNMAIWWFFHISVFFYKIMFPFHSRRMEKLGYEKYLAIILITLGFVIPLPAVIVALSTENHRYRIVKFPPDVCITDGKMWFYSTTLVFTIVIGTGVFFLIIVFWEINKHQSSNQKRYGNKQTFSTAEKKIIIIFLYFILFGVYTMAHYGVVTGYSKRETDVLVEYFICEASGHVPGKCDRSAFQRHSFLAYMSAISYILFGLIPLTVLNFIVNWNRLWKSLKRQLFKNFTHKPSSQAPTSLITTLKVHFKIERFNIRSTNYPSSKGDTHPNSLVTPV